MRIFFLLTCRVLASLKRPWVLALLPSGQCLVAEITPFRNLQVKWMTEVQACFLKKRKNTILTWKKNDTLWLCRHEYLAGISKMNKIICHFKKNNWQFCFPMITFEHSSEYQNFGKSVSTTINVTVFQYLKALLIS